MDRYSIKFQRSKKNNFGGWSFFEIKNYDGREINLIYQPEEGFLLTFVLSKGGNTRFHQGAYVFEYISYFVKLYSGYLTTMMI